MAENASLAQKSRPEPSVPHAPDGEPQAEGGKATTDRQPG